jgi:hypothetical protein
VAFIWPDFSQYLRFAILACNLHLMRAGVASKG